VASPLGHVVVGVGVATAVGGALGTDATSALWVGGAVSACLPDLDLMVCLLGLPYQRVHRQASHSLPVLASLAAFSWWTLQALQVPVDWRLMVAWTAALMSHLLLDIVCTGPVLGGLNHGIPLLWPLTVRRWYVRQPMLPEVNLLENPSPGTIARTCLQEMLHLGPAGALLIVLGRLLP
jgi:membrane-bound metal-dependent hydrolase YbcI (DUF457 family)